MKFLIGILIVAFSIEGALMSIMGLNRAGVLGKRRLTV